MRKTTPLIWEPPEQLLEGFRFNYQYQNQTAIHIELE